MNAKRNLIFLVDDDTTSLKMGRTALSDTYDVFTAPSAEKMFALLAQHCPDMILLDIDMPGMSGYEAIKLLKQNDATRGIPVIFLTGMSNADDEVNGLSLGAVDYISKPWRPALLLKRIELHLLFEAQKQTLKDQQKQLRNFNENLMAMVEKKTQTVMELQKAIIKTMTELVEYRDDITGSHIEHTQMGTQILIDALLKHNDYHPQITAWDIDLLLQSSQLHDVGKIAISDNILRKESALTADEFEEMKKHTTFGVAVIEKIEESTKESEFLNYAKIFAGWHHEKWDGTGYPHGTRGKNIPLQARILSIVDVYDAITSERSYKPARPHQDALQIILDGRGTQFDPALVDVFMSVQGQFKYSFKSL
jgi:putative two-component system response regulator